MPEQITIDLEKYNTILQQREEALAANIELAKAFNEAKLADPTGQVPALVECIKAALPIISFAVGNLDPTTVRGWPYNELQTFADVLADMPGADAEIKEAANDFRNFITEARQVEGVRARRDSD